MTQQSYRLGDHGPAVAQIRDHLALLGLLSDEPAERSSAEWDAAFDAEVDAAVRAFQQQRGLIADGVVGPSTWRRLDGARWALGDRVLRYGTRHMQHGDDVAALQKRLHDLGFDPGRIDGIFGPDTEHGLKELQRNLGIPADGLCGPVTFRSLDRLARTVVGGEPHRIREAERLHHRGPGLAGKVIVIDPGHGGPDRGVCANGLAEADVVADLASRIEGRLGAVGVTAFLTRGTSVDTPTASEPERASFANEVDADLVISLHTDGHDSPHAQGVATFYYGTSGGSSDAVGDRRDVRRPGAARDRGSHRPARRTHRRQDLGHPAAHGDAGRPDRRRIPDAPRRRRAAGRPGVARHDRRRRRCRAAAALPAHDRPAA